MSDVAWLAVTVAAVLGMLVGAVVVWLRLGEARSSERIARARAEEQASRVPLLEEALRASQDRLEGLAARNAEVQASLREQAEAHVRQIEVMTQVRGEIEKDLKNLANEALKSNQASFLEVARQVLDHHRKTAEGELDRRREAIQAMLQPVSETLQKYQANLQEIEKARSQTYGALSAELKAVAQAQLDVRAETGRLVNALRAAPKTRGRWGEQQLQNVMELSGMTPYVDFTTEQSFDREEGRLRPDAIIRLPGERFIVVDAKTSMAAYLDAVESVDEAEREAHLCRHAQQLRSHVKQLSSKAYWDGLTVTPDFVAMFIPGDNLFAAAMERDPQLFEDAVASRVLMVTPTTLIALAKAIAFGWRQEKIAENARVVAGLGRELYRRLSVMGAHVAAVGRGLEGAVKGYNKFVGSLESNVMPQARRFQELEVEGTGDALPELEPVEAEVRPIRGGKDLLLGSDRDPEPPSMHA